MNINNFLQQLLLIRVHFCLPIIHLHVTQRNAQLQELERMEKDISPYPNNLYNHWKSTRQYLYPSAFILNICAVCVINAQGIVMRTFCKGYFCYKCISSLNKIFISNIFQFLRFTIIVIYIFFIQYSVFIFSIFHFD